MILVSIALYAATSRFNWNLPAYPDEKVWFFNPMAWQVVFYMRRGAGGNGSPGSRSSIGGGRLTVVLAIAYLAFAASHCIVLAL